MPRLKSTKNIFNNKNNTTIALVRKIDLQVGHDYRRLNHLRGSLIRSSQLKTVERISKQISDAAVEMGLNPTTTVDKDKLLARIRKYKQQNSYLQYAALHQAVIALCANYEDFINRVIVKYFEEDVKRLTNTRQTVTSQFVIDAVKRGDNLHHTLAEKAARDSMYGGLKVWYKYLSRMGMNLGKIPHPVHEVFLIRHCIVHNNRRVSSELHAKNPHKYPLRRSIHFTLQDIEQMKTDLHIAMKDIANEYNRLFPSPGGTWIDTPKDEEIN